MGVDKAWTDPITGTKFSYSWGFDTDKIEDAATKRILKEMEKVTMEKISYVCSRCKHNINCNPYCVDCDRGSKFVENVPYDRMYRMGGRQNGKTMMQAEIYARMLGLVRLPKIEKVMFNPPATIVFWADKTKTVVKAQGTDAYDPEKGLAMAIIKKICGNKGNYNNIFHQWIKEDPIPETKDITPKEDLKWRIWFQRFDTDGKPFAAGVLQYKYTRRGDATRRARKHFDGQTNVEWTVSQTNPWEDK